jgi:hypothetical protein
MAGKRPIGVTILMVLGYIGSALAIIGGIMIIAGGSLLSSFSSVPGLSVLIGAGAAILGIITIAFGVLGIFIAKGLGEGKNWAKIVAIIFAVLGLLSSLWPINIVGIVIEGVIIWYLGFSKEAKAYFR